ncbi:fish-egg lectin-like [Lissotriton helveticus]
MACIQIPGALVQIDAGNGLVFGVNQGQNIYTLFNGQWVQLSGALIHVTTGAAGVWGVNNANMIYKLVGGAWTLTSGLLKQIDAGGVQFIAGVNTNNNIYCLSGSATVSANGGSPLPWTSVPGSLKYYSCGPRGCWGVNTANAIYYRYSTTPASCAGTSWQLVSGSLVMIEVGSDGSVYGVNSGGVLYRRDGITASAPTGTTWTSLQYQNRQFRHVSADLGLIWAITTDQQIFRCQA